MPKRPKVRMVRTNPTVGSLVRIPLWGMNQSCDYEVSGVILFQAYPYNYSLLKGVTFNVLPLSNYALNQMLLRLMKKKFGTRKYLSVPSSLSFLNVFITMKFSTFLSRLHFWKQPQVIRSQIREQSGYYTSVTDLWFRNSWWAGELP